MLFFFDDAKFKQRRRKKPAELEEAGKYLLVDFFLLLSECGEVGEESEDGQEPSPSSLHTTLAWCNWYT